jgi:hypothetical protein
MSTLRILSIAAALALVAGAPACKSSPTSPGGAFRTEVTLKPGEVTAVASTPLRVAFQRVENDSRCPINALCIQAGDALVAVWASVDNGAGSEVSLRTRGGATTDHLRAVVGDYQLSIGALQPSRITTSPIEPGEYRLTLVIERE